METYPGGVAIDDSFGGKDRLCELETLQKKLPGSALILSCSFPDNENSKHIAARSCSGDQFERSAGLRTMAQESNEGIAYLMALKRSSGPAAAAPAREDSPATSAIAPPNASQDSYQGPEKRRSPRYKCEGSAEMCEVSCDIRTWATFTDISMHGCYLEAQATYPVGTVLRLKLEANGTKVEVTGNVRVSYPYLGMGIAFASITEEHQARLRDLLASLSRPSVIMGPGIASSLPARGPLEAIPAIADANAALEALTDFFQNRQMLMREDFVRIVHQSQAKK